MLVEQKYIDRFWARVNKSEGCWLWTGAVNNSGYGVTDVGRTTMSAHRFALSLATGQWPGRGTLARHLCPVDGLPNRLCVNPGHLAWGSPLDNSADQIVQRGRHSSAKLTAEQVLEVRALRASGLRLREIGDRFGIGDAAVSLICSGLTWKHVA